MIRGSFGGGRGVGFGPPRISDPRTTYCTMGHCTSMPFALVANLVCPMLWNLACVLALIDLWPVSLCLCP